ncbi:septal ring lytic transglycosylase RlpA family protein [Pseudochelatococcus contaminans]|uniref:Endolytic peptidoglycan transglycosylase RlpA n=1 Tax=Pseudochelatococcus contaminans TaxID=1538103 RepID=A0A7W5Z116_9HYPH|nr:septal ring lytic transglycosylase RlpA family protein [Pseudochelatococcus contaminans]MBB3808090.1 rare lipoprotein A [Pseudochelatococcus contaminans]
MRDGPMRLTKRANITNHPENADEADASSVDKPRHIIHFPLSARTTLKVVAVSVVALGLANCSSAPRSTGLTSTQAKVDPKYGVKPSPRVVKSGNVPKGGGRAMVGKPYVVAGKKFTPNENENYVAVGTASWYGSQFHGRKTANGEVFDKYSFAAAHPTLPLPSYVRVTNLTNKRSMIVRVNDRGPFHGNRLIDLSKGAAEALDFHRQGTARVKVEYVGRASLGGSDDRKLLATLNADAPATIPASAPAAVPAPAPVMVASAEPPAPVVTEPAAPPAVVQETVRPTARTLVARPAEPEPSADTLVAGLPEPQAPAPSRRIVAPPQTMAFANPPQESPAVSPLTDLVREVSTSEANAPLPPSRPAELARRRTLLGTPTAAASETLQGAPAAAPTRRALVANLAAPAQREATDSSGVYFEPMPLSQLTPQRFVAFGGTTNGQPQ